MALPLLLFAAVLFVFGVVFMLAGRSGERGYWTQRDTQETPGQDDTRIAEVAKHVGDYAMHGKRPSLRIMAAGLLMVGAAVIIGIVGLIASVV